MFETQQNSHPRSLILNSYKKKILYRIISSVRHYLFIKDIIKAEAGLVTALNLAGFISKDITEVKKPTEGPNS